jgi:hypothetical protein
MTDGFFEPGRSYIQARPFAAPETVEIFRCVGVGMHPAKHEMRAFGFIAHVYPGDDWFSAALDMDSWEAGWQEVSPTKV